MAEYPERHCMSSVINLRNTWWLVHPDFSRQIRMLSVFCACSVCSIPTVIAFWLDNTTCGSFGWIVVSWVKNARKETQHFASPEDTCSFFRLLPGGKVCFEIMRPLLFPKFSFMQVSSMFTTSDFFGPSRAALAHCKNDRTLHETRAHKTPS